MSISSIKKYSSLIEVLGKYGSVSVAATVVDFIIFSIALYTGISVVMSTVIGRSAGAVVAFILHRNWVFESNGGQRPIVLILRFIVGVLIGMGLNVGIVWLLTTYIHPNPWFARVVAACSVWFSMFLYNKYFVFNKKS
jgi:putative flippase GtrA